MDFTRYKNKQARKTRLSSIIKLKIQEILESLNLYFGGRYVECWSNGNSHCPSKYVVSCCHVKFKVLQHIRKTFGEVVKDAKSTHRQVYKYNIIAIFLLLPNQGLIFELLSYKPVSYKNTCILNVASYLLSVHVSQKKTVYISIKALKKDHLIVYKMRIYPLVHCCYREFVGLMTPGQAGSQRKLVWGH